MLIDPLTKIALTTAAKIALNKMLVLLPNNARAVDEAYTVMLQDMALAVDAAFRAHLAHHEEKDPEFAQKLAAALDEREARALFFRLTTDGAEATTVERMRMLAHALAGLYTPDLNIEMRSRVSRAVLALEPSDVAALREAMVADDSRTRKVDGTIFVLSSLTPSRAYEGLKAAGCIQDDNETRGGLYVTELGRAVVKALELWRSDAESNTPTSAALE